jgi:hypothetical protein
MPLPETSDSTRWPPPADQAIHDTIRKWAAWYEGDREKLELVYGGNDHRPATHSRAGIAHAGGIVGVASRLFWGQPVMAGQQSTKLHVPAAADIAQTSAELLFSEPPAMTLDTNDTTAQDRIDELFGEKMWDRLLDAASLQAGLGGVFLRGGWDRERMPGRPLMSVIGPDYACPRFLWGDLVEVTFTWILPGDTATTVRYLEHHTVGAIEHGLFIGSGDKLGRRVPLDEHPETADLARLVNSDSVVPTELPMLTAIYVPNRTATAWRGDSVGSNLGQADIAVVERAGLLDALDEDYSSWQRDIRLGKARAITSRGYLQSNGPGRGSSFDMDQELFVEMDIPGKAGDQKPVELIQAEIRWEAMQATCKSTFERVVDGSGYSAQTFGLTGDVAITATESNARERKTNRTRGGKARDWTRAIPDLTALLLAIDQTHLGGKVAPIRPNVEFPPMVRDSIETTARTVSMLDGSASTAERVRLLHPTWKQEQVDKEVADIAAERAMLTPIDPFTPTVDGSTGAGATA